MLTPVTWTINSVKALPQVGEFTNVVVRATYTVSARDTYTGRHIDDAPDAPERELTALAEEYGVARFELDPNGEFVPAESLTKSLILEWVKGQLGEDAVRNIESSLRDRVDSIKNPPQPVEVTLNLE